MVNYITKIRACKVCFFIIIVVYCKKILDRIIENGKNRENGRVAMEFMLFLRRLLQKAGENIYRRVSANNLPLPIVQLSLWSAWGGGSQVLATAPMGERTIHPTKRSLYCTYKLSPRTSKRGRTVWCTLPRESNNPFGESF